MKSVHGLPAILLLVLYLIGLIATGLSLVSANPTTQPRVAKSIRHRTRVSSRRSRGDNLDSLKKRTLVDLLHYQGLEDPPEQQHNDVPEYVQYAFQALDDSNCESWQQNKGDLHKRSSEQTIWGIKVHQVVDLHRDTQIQFRIQKEVFLVNRSHVELVFTGNGPDQSSTRLRQISMCSGGQHFRTCETETHITPDTIRINSDVFHVYHLTQLFENWVSSLRNNTTPVPLLINIPRSESHVDGMFTRPHSDGPLLVIYSNLPDFLLKDYIIAQDLQTQQINSRSQTRLRRSVPRTDPANSDYYETSTFSLNRVNEPPYCSLVEWYVDFSVIGWDSFIIHPKGYRGNLCLGSCNIPMLGNRVNISNHAFIKNLYHLEMVYGGRSDLGHYLPRVSCMPLRLHPVSMMFKSGIDTFVNRRLNDMQADQCSCL